MSEKRRVPNLSVGGRPTPRECGCKDPSLLSVEDIGATDIERIILNLSRCVLFGYTHDSIDPWNHAVAMAEHYTDQENGGVLMVRVLNVVRAMRQERVQNYSFMPVGCSRMTSDEVALMSSVQSALRAGTSEENFPLDALIGRAFAPLTRKSLMALKSCANLLSKDTCTDAISHPVHHPGSSLLN